MASTRESPELPEPPEPPEPLDPVLVPRRRWLWAALPAAVFLAGAAALSPLVLARLRAPAALPSSRGAYRHGGRPAPGTDEARAVFSRDLAAFTIALDRLRVARGSPGETPARQVVRQRSEAVAAAAERALGPGVTSYLRAVIDQSIAIVTTDELVDAAIETHVRSVDALDASLQGQGLGLYVDAHVAQEIATGRHRVYLSSFTVEHVALYESAGRTVRALHLRRLDPLNFQHGMLGFTRDEIRDALVLLDRIEEHMVRDLLPALATPMRLVASRAPTEPLLEEAERAAAEDVRAEARAAHADAAELASLGQLYARRRDMFEGWQRLLAPRGLELRLPDRYGLDLASYDGLEQQVPADEWRKVEELRDALSSPALAATLRDLEAPLIASIERHEAQHRLDTLDGDPSSCPADVAALVACESPLGRRVLAETSAYVAELGRGPSLVRTNLALLARYLLDPELLGAAESYAALIALTGLARELGLPTGPLLGPTGLDRAAAARLYLGLRGKPAGALSAAATRAWQGLFGRPLPPLRVVPR